MLTLRDPWERLLSELRAIDPPGLRNLRQPRAQADVVSALAAIGLDPDPAVLEWFSWHDGQHFDEGEPALGVTPGCTLRSLDDAVRATRFARELDIDNDPSRWGPSWLSICDGLGAGDIVANCAPVIWGGDGKSRVHHFFWGDVGTDAAPEGRAPTIRAMVDLWADAVADGGWSTDTDDWWQIDLDRLPKPLRRGALG